MPEDLETSLRARLFKDWAVCVIGLGTIVTITWTVAPGRLVLHAARLIL